MTTFVTRLLGMPMVASEHGTKIDNLIWYLHLLMAVLFVGWLAYFVYVLIRFRSTRSKKADYLGVRNHTSSYIEGMVAFIEAVLLIGFAIPLWSMTVDEYPDEEVSEQIHVVGRQFNWTGRYPGPDKTFGRQDVNLVDKSNPFGVVADDPNSKDDFSVLTEIVVPLNKDVICHVTSLDVIHSFCVRPMRVTQDATPGLKIPVTFKPIREGSYQIMCAQLCGNGHYAMMGTLKVVSQSEYAEWVASNVPALEEENVEYADEGDYE